MSQNRYYILQHSLEKSEIGATYPQVQKMTPGYNYKSDRSVYAISRTPGLPDFEPDLDHFILHGWAKLSDLLSVAVIHGGILVSKRFKELLEEFNLVTHRFYSAKVSHKKQLYDYYWMHIVSDLTDKVDYNASSFFIYQTYAHNLGAIKISSKDELIEERKKIKAANPEKTITIWANEIVMNKLFDNSLDIFEIGSFDSHTYISNALKEAIITNNITGCHIKEAGNLVSS